METEKMFCGCGANVFWFTRERAAQLRKDKEMDKEEKNTRIFSKHREGVDRGRHTNLS